ncbi:MAG: TlpA family protein disulfide reductase [Gammaproteobacteria bacterium]|nr:TlpA family protein disulfide reductase [Gammaproteobacteria bacterium]
MKKLILSVLISGLISVNAYSYEVGDRLDEDVIKQLNLPEGKVGVIDFFASWCESCTKEIPEIKKFITQDTEKEAHVVGIDVDEELNEGLEYQKQLNIEFPVINDTHQKIVSAFSPIAMPALYYVKDNKVVGKRIGAIYQIDQQIKKDLQGFGVESE